LTKVKFNEKHKEILDSFLLGIPIVIPGKMYGYPAYYVGGKLFASLYNTGVCIKIPESRVKELLIKEGIFPFEPMGRMMREWIFIIRENSEDYQKDRAIFMESIDFVSSISDLNIKKNKVLK
jgi:hypothetical protein